jgi:hypothetical protein
MLAMKAHTSGKRRKRPVNKTNELGEQAGSEAGYPKRPKIQPKPEPGVADTACVDEDSPSSPAQCPPLSGYDLDRLNYHVDLEDFGKGLQNAANAVFSSDQRSRYTQVSALLLSWEDEDPQLPVSLEINALKDVLVNLYEFEVEEWKIPTEGQQYKASENRLLCWSWEVEQSWTGNMDQVNINLTLSIVSIPAIDISISVTEIV